jgi:hypothetical protein
MADYFSTSSNFVNPDYASPEQLAQQRAYADALMKRSGESATRPTGAIGNMIDALTAGLTRNSANALQNQMAQANAHDLAAVVSQLQNGQRPDAQTLARVYANPMASPEHRALIDALIKPQPVKDEYGNPAYAAPSSGVQPAPIQGRPGTFQPAYRVHQGAEGVSTDAPIPAPGPVAPPTMAPRAPVASTPRVWGDKEAEAAGIYPTPPGGGGGPAPVAGSPPAAAPAIPNRPLTLDELAAKGREFSAQKAFTQGSAQTITGVQNEDIAAANNAPTIKRIAGTMLDDLTTHGDKMTFGPTAEWSNQVKRLAANYAPGLMRNQLESLASADSFDKMSAQLTSMLAKGGGTDAQLFNNMKSVPGAHNSKEGAKALLLMVNQVADQQAALRNAVAGARTPQEYEALRSQFFKDNPVINPITGHPIALDLQQSGGGGAAKGPPVGSVHSGYKFKGGDPNNQNSWEKVQ